MMMTPFLLQLVFLSVLQVYIAWASHSNFFAGYTPHSLIQSLQTEPPPSLASTGLPYADRDTYVHRQGLVYEIKAYEDALFQLLRRKAGLSEALYHTCLCSGRVSPLSADSKSGQIFCRSQDGLVIIKSLKGYEKETLLELLGDFAAHVLGGESLLGNLLGLYRVKILPNNTVHYLLVLKNVYHSAYEPRSSSGRPCLLCDLKGSTIGRAKAEGSAVLKDLDVLHALQSHALQIGPENKQRLLAALERDAAFLQSMGLMDYSLLVRVDYNALNADVNSYTNADTYSNPFSSNSYCDSNGNAVIEQGRRDLPHAFDNINGGKMVMFNSQGDVYHFGIIDFLQRYTARKTMETLLKGVYHKGTEGVSCVSPAQYAVRLLRFIDHISF